jgi:coatomer subunit zeta
VHPLHCARYLPDPLQAPAASLGTMPINMSLFSVNAILVMATDDRSRLLARYYSPPHHEKGSTGPGTNPWPTVKEQKAFE